MTRMHAYAHTLSAVASRTTLTCRYEIELTSILCYFNVLMVVSRTPIHCHLVGGDGKSLPKRTSNEKDAQALFKKQRSALS